MRERRLVRRCHTVNFVGVVGYAKIAGCDNWENFLLIWTVCA
jgi:hypothetical protein